MKTMMSFFVYDTDVDMEGLEDLLGHRLAIYRFLQIAMVSKGIN